MNDFPERLGQNKEQKGRVVADKEQKGRAFVQFQSLPPH
jgi:hypothetical protein